MLYVLKLVFVSVFTGSQHSSYQNQYSAYASGADQHSVEVYDEDDAVEYDSDEYDTPSAVKRQKI